jgi:hypothetical protein
VSGVCGVGASICRHIPKVLWMCHVLCFWQVGADHQSKCVGVVLWVLVWYQKYMALQSLQCMEVCASSFKCDTVCVVMKACSV